MLWLPQGQGFGEVTWKPQGESSGIEHKLRNTLKGEGVDASVRPHRCVVIGERVTEGEEGG